MKTKLNIYIYSAIGLIVIELLLFHYVKLNSVTSCRKKHYRNVELMRFNHEKEKKKLIDDYEKSRYLASGETAYERIYNIQNQSIVDMITRLATESFSMGWMCETKVEEFTNFILLVQNEIKGCDYSIHEIIKHLTPVVTYAQPYLQNIVVFDKKHKCIMFFDNNAVNELIMNKKLAQRTIEDIFSKGQEFTRYNSITIEYEDVNGHMMVPAVIGGNCEIIMMLDTGASTTVISAEVAGKTSYENEDWNKVERREFSTASGSLVCPIVERKVSIGSIDIVLPVAINLKQETNLLGVDFFNDYSYSTDSESKCIYVWSK